MASKTHKMQLTGNAGGHLGWRWSIEKTQRGKGTLSSHVSQHKGYQPESKNNVPSKICI